jgi:hypothetical protein
MHKADPYATGSGILAVWVNWGSILLCCSCAPAPPHSDRAPPHASSGPCRIPAGPSCPTLLVKLINEGTRQTFEARTSSSGAYAFEAVQTGEYQLDVEAKGFRKYSARNNLVTIGQPATINVKLELGTLVDTVEVQSAAERCRPRTPATTAT